MKASDNSHGFTLTELLIWPKGHLRVLLIIGIPVAIAIPDYTKFIPSLPSPLIPSLFAGIIEGMLQ
jgi:Tfp pilus assembly protein FimT